jgi:hypothetical protein
VRASLAAGDDRLSVNPRQRFVAGGFQYLPDDVLTLSTGRKRHGKPCARLPILRDVPSERARDRIAFFGCNFPATAS